MLSKAATTASRSASGSCCLMVPKATTRRTDSSPESSSETLGTKTTGICLRRAACLSGSAMAIGVSAQTTTASHTPRSRARMTPLKPSRRNRGRVLSMSWINLVRVSISSSLSESESRQGRLHRLDRRGLDPTFPRDLMADIPLPG